MSEMEQQPICKIALGIEYDGSKYYGWQRQNEVRSVQEKLEKALSQVANEPITVFCAGRTDAGVHGTGQVVHFETRAQAMIIDDVAIAARRGAEPGVKIRRYMFDPTHRDVTR